MELGHQHLSLSQVMKQRNRLLIGLVVATMVIVIQAMVLLLKDTIVVVTPSVISQEYSISDRHVSRHYLEDMSRDVITTLLNLTPKNVGYMTDTVLKMVHPSAYGKVKKELLAMQEDVVVRKVSTVFYPISMHVEELTVTIEGDFYTFIGSQLANQQRRTFAITYDYTGAKLTIGGFREITL